MFYFLYFLSIFSEKHSVDEHLSALIHKVSNVICVTMQSTARCRFKIISTLMMTNNENHL